MRQTWETLLDDDEPDSSTPELFKINAAMYFKWCEEHPVESKIPLINGRRSGEEVVRKHTRAYTVKGLCLHCGITEEYLMAIRNYRDKTNPWYRAVSKVMYIIYDQNQTGAMVDIFNSTFTAKVLNLEREETPRGAVKVEIVDVEADLLESEDEILKKLEFENPDWIEEINKKS